MIAKGCAWGRSLLVALLVLLTCVSVVQAQPISPTRLKPRLIVRDQQLVDDQITVAEAVVPEAGWVAVYRSQDGNLDTMIGLAPLSAGVNTNVVVEINLTLATPMLYALLHTDNGRRGIYEFPGADTPIIVSNPPMLAFQLAGLPPKHVVQTAETPTLVAALPSPTPAEEPVGMKAPGQPNNLYLPLIHSTLTLAGTVTQAANLRAGPGVTFSIVGRARARQRILLVACNENCSWYQLDSGNWIAAFLVRNVAPDPALLPRVPALP